MSQQRRYRREKKKELLHKLNVLAHDRDQLGDSFIAQLTEIDFDLLNKGEHTTLYQDKWAKFNAIQAEMKKIKDEIGLLLEFREKNKITGGSFATDIRKKRMDELKQQSVHIYDK